MTTLPTGRVTFAFTDIEGSTSMLQRLGAGFVSVLETHNRIVRETFCAHRGVEVGNEGDAFFFVFTGASDAVAAAVAVQHSLAARTWPEGGTVRIRIGLHTGEGELGGDDYVGIDVNRAARIGAAGHGGQILTTESTVRAAGPLPEGASLADLGLHRFKDLTAPVHVWQVSIADLPVDFPPIRALDIRPNNLPMVASGFVGREDETRSVVRLLDAHRVVTLVGPGGTGKTRLAIRVASRLVDRYPGGVLYVALDSIADADLVGSAIAAAARIDVGERDPVDAVIEQTAPDGRLLVLDNFEHVLAARDVVRTIVESCPGATVLVTSRVVLRIPGEHVFEVPPLPAREAADLFVARARAADPMLEIDETDIALIDELVDRLDALPLAIELAAARVRLLGLRGLHDRMSERLELPGTGTGAAERHETMRAAIAWSLDLLDETVRRTLRQLSVFEGGFTLDAAEAVVETDSTALPAVATLLDSSLLSRRIVDGETRFSMLDSIRDFAAMELADSKDADPTRRRHAGYFAELAARARELLEGEAQIVWLDRLADDHDNLRAVARHAFDTGRPDHALLAIGASWRFWHRRGHLVEARELLDRLLGMEGAAPSAEAEGLNGRAAVAYWLGRYDEAATLYERLVVLFGDLGEQRRVGDSLFGLSSARIFEGEAAAGLAAAESAKAVFQGVGDLVGERRAMAAIAFAMAELGRLEESLEMWKVSAAGFEEDGNLGERLQTGAVMAGLIHRLGDTDEALDRMVDVLDGFEEIGDVAGTTMALDMYAAILATVEPEEGVMLAAAAEAMRTRLGGGVTARAMGLPTARDVAEPVIGIETAGRIVQEGVELDLETATGRAREIHQGIRLGSAPGS